MIDGALLIPIRLVRAAQLLTRSLVAARMTIIRRSLYIDFRQRVKIRYSGLGELHRTLSVDKPASVNSTRPFPSTN